MTVKDFLSDTPITTYSTSTRLANGAFSHTTTVPLQPSQTSDVNKFVVSGVSSIWAVSSKPVKTYLWSDTPNTTTLDTNLGLSGSTMTGDLNTMNPEKMMSYNRYRLEITDLSPVVRGKDINHQRRILVLEDEMITDPSMMLKDAIMLLQAEKINAALKDRGLSLADVVIDVNVLRHYDLEVKD